MYKTHDNSIRLVISSLSTSSFPHTQNTEATPNISSNLSPHPQNQASDTLTTGAGPKPAAGTDAVEAAVASLKPSWALCAL